MSAIPVGVAFPVAARDREDLRRQFPRKPLPAIKARSEVRRCAMCPIQVAVGPRLRATGLRVICPRCAHGLGMRDFW